MQFASKFLICTKQPDRKFLDARFQVVLQRNWARGGVRNADQTPYLFRNRSAERETEKKAGYTKPIDADRFLPACIFNTDRRTHTCAPGRMTPCSSARPRSFGPPPVRSVGDMPCTRLRSSCPNERRYYWGVVSTPHDSKGIASNHFGRSQRPHR